MMNACPECKQLRDENHFRAKMSSCVFCELDHAYAHADRLLSYLNNHAPVGQHLQQMCFGCKTLCWWVNLKPHGEHEYCPTCLDRKGEEAEEKAKVVAASNEQVMSLFQ